MKPGIAARVRLLAVAPLAALGIVSVVAVTVLVGRELSTRIQRDVQATSGSLGTYVSSERRALERETRILADVPYIRDAALIQADPTKPVLLHDGRTAQNALDDYARKNEGQLILIDESGKALAASGPLHSLVGRSPHEFGIDGALSDGKAWSGIARFPEGIVLAASAPLMFGGYPRGVLVSYTVVDSSTATTLATQLGIQVVFVDHGRPLGGSLPLSISSIAQSGDVRIVSKGTGYIGRYAPLPGSRPDQMIGFVGLRPIDEITGRTPQAIEALLAVIVIAGVFGGLLAGRLAKGFTDPLQAIVSAARRIEAGEWPEAVPVTGIEEFGILQTAFNRMTDSVHAQQEKLKGMIDLDPLTELPNHRRLKQNLGIAIAEEHASSRKLSLLVLDIDRFDDYNRHHGLSAGEEVLLVLAEIAKSSAPQGAQVARYGGDEIALLLPGLGPQQTGGLAEDIRREFNGRTRPNALTLSGGFATVTPTTDRPESLSLATELALAKAKQLGRDQVCDFQSLVGEQGNDPYELHRFLENATVATIQALAAAVDAKDTYTQGHSQRVAQYASDLCRAAGGSVTDIELVYRTGTLHDVGKIGIPDDVLKKQGPLTPEERAVMETHPALGEVIVQKVPHLQDTLPGVRHHHERWDGKGYPDGLAGETIPWLARLLAVADTYDAMTSDRPYRKGLSVDIALGEIEKNAGVQFDPELAHLFVKLMTEQRQAA